MSTTTKEPAVTRFEMAPKTHRALDAIDAELAALKTRYLEMERQNRDYGLRRTNQMKRRDRLETLWKKENPNEPFDPSIYTPPAIVDPAETLLTREFHRIHYTIDRVAAELDAAKKAEVGEGT